MSIHGTVAPQYERVRAVFAGHFVDGSDVGAACCVHIDGEAVVDLWGGVADRPSGIPWNADTPALIFSATKGLTAICVLKLVQSGSIDLDAPVAKYWPEFACEGKHSITIRWLLSHRAGVPAIDKNFSLDDVLNWHGVIAAVAAQKPEWPPGTRHGYHARSFGWIAGEVVRRVTAESIGEFFAKQVAQPLNADAWIGLPEAIEPKTANIVPPDASLLQRMNQYMGSGTLADRVMNGPNHLFTCDQRWNTRAYRAAEIPSSNGVCTARALSRIYAATIGEIDGVRLLDAAIVDAARTEHSSGTDAVLGLPTCFGLGFSLPPTLLPVAPRGSFGHAGAGGAHGFADPSNRLAFAYVPNRLSLVDHARANALSKAVYESLERQV